jgi:hypothetical protein
MGLFTKIKNVFSPPREEYEDPVFGKLWREGKGMWMGEAPFDHARTGARTMSLLIDAGEGRPTEAQKDLFREVIGRYAARWPQIASALAQHHPELKTVQDVTEHIGEPCL